MLIKSNIQAICFDAFGTLVDITDKHRPYRGLLDALDSKASLALKDRVMREPLSLQDCIAGFGPSLPEETKQALEQGLSNELASIRVRPHINELWTHLKQSGYKIALCSNLALPYGPALLKALPGETDALILSYETGFIKPEAEIYQLVCDKLGLPAQNILFTGDTLLADVTGPKAFGMEAELIDAFVARFLKNKGS